MIALVDHDNVPAPPGRPVHLVRRLLDAVTATVPVGAALHCRLYGGWYDGPQLSQRARDLAKTLRVEFPLRMRARPRGVGGTVRVTAELACTLADDGADFTHTYRRRAAPAGLRCSAAPFPGCALPSSCPVAGIERFLNDAECPAFDCGVTPGALLQRAEQKLVDAMLVTDLVRLAPKATEPLIVVSSDDDLWPGIRSALLDGAHVVHVQTTERTPPYGALTTSAYARVTGRW